MKALGLEPVKPTKPARKINVSEAIKLRFQKGLTYEEIAQYFGCRNSSVYEALAPYKDILGRAAVSVSDDSMGELLSAAATVHLAECVRPEKVEKMSGKDSAVAAGILLDKSRLFKGQSTSHTSVFFHVVSESDQLKTPIIDVTPDNSDT